MPDQTPVLGAYLRVKDTHPRVTADEFNARYPIGTPATAYPAARPEDDPNAEQLTTHTRSRAFNFAGTAVVMVDGYERITLTHIDPAT
ncbi:hypothetical protein [Streptomyces chartreusis]|uniref:hypothetical protein n=1 Tax=Streptomyces chartreusis TaxID=1969 RepID=UPI00382C44AA